MKVILLLCALFVAACYCSSGVGVLDPLEFRSVESLELDTLQARESFSMNYSPGSGPAGTVITISYSSSQVANAWIGLFATGSSTTSVFKYLTANSGSMTLSTTGLAAGSYKINFVYNSYIQIQASYTVTGSSGTSGGTSGNPTSTSGNPTSGTSGNPSTSGTSGSSGSSNPGGDASTWLNEHNKRRAGVSPNLSWSNKLAASALNWAKTMASKCSMYHSGKYGVGENIAYGYGSIAQVMTAWADNEKKYYSNGQCSGGVCGHYTQVMWKSTTLVGCGIAYCGSTPYYACQYIRPGNCNGYNFLQASSACPYFDDSQV